MNGANGLPTAKFPVITVGTVMDLAVITTAWRMQIVLSVNLWLSWSIKKQDLKWSLGG